GYAPLTTYSYSRSSSCSRSALARCTSASGEPVRIRPTTRIEGSPRAVSPPADARALRGFAATSANRRSVGEALVSIARTMHCLVELLPHALTQEWPGRMIAPRNHASTDGTRCCDRYVASRGLGRGQRVRTNAEAWRHAGLSSAQP